MKSEQNFTKAKSLLHLIGKLHHSVIPELLVINKYDWEGEKHSCLETIKIKFLEKPLPSDHLHSMRTPEKLQMQVHLRAFWTSTQNELLQCHQQ